MRPGANRDAWIAFVAVLTAVVFVLLAFAESGKAWTSSARLSQVASIFAMRPVRVQCYDQVEEDSPNLIGAWGYVEKPLATAEIAHVDDQLCAAALDLNGDRPPWERALGVLVIVHESYHLRRWGAAGDEAKVECKAIRHWRVAARLLGATEETVAELWPAALAAHYQLANYSSWWVPGVRPYYDPSCIVPPLIDEG